MAWVRLENDYTGEVLEIPVPDYIIDKKDILHYGLMKGIDLKFDFDSVSIMAM